MSMPPRLAAIVLNFGAPDDTCLAVRSLLLSSRPIDDLIVVDNDAVPGCEVRLARSDAVRYHRTGRNLGFSGGMNVGIGLARRAGAERVLLVNSDAVVTPRTIAALERALEREPSGACPRRGIVAPTLLARASPDVVVSDGMRFNSRTGRMRHLQAGDRSPSTPTERVVDAVSGCVMLVDVAVFDAVGLFDEPYFFGFEDLDFCLRARRAGFTSVVTRDAVALHEGARSIGAASSDRLYYAARNHLRLAARVAPLPVVMGSMRAAAIVGLNLAYAATTHGGTITSRVGAVLRGTAHHLMGRHGPAT